MMIGIGIEPRLRTPHRARRCATSLLSLLLGAAVICGAFGLAASRDPAVAQQLRCGKGNVLDRIWLGSACPPLSGAEVRKELQQQRAADRIAQDLRKGEAAMRAARARRAGEDLARGIGAQPRPVKAPRRLAGMVAGHAKAHRAAGDGRHVGARHAGVGSLERAYRHVKKERRAFDHAAVRFVRMPGYRTFAGLRHEFGQLRSARAQFHRSGAHGGRHR
jgi:hypothetical protein